MNQPANETVYEQVKASFGPNARMYTISQGHADARALQQMVEKVQPKATDTLLDIGTGAGHTAIAFAPFVNSVVAFDLTPQMLEEVQRNAAAKGIINLLVRQGAAENLPYQDNSFEIVTCRLTTHHFANLPQAVAEMARVLTPGGKLAIVDTTVPEDATLDHQINEIEILRDPSHVRNYPASEWQAIVEKAGLQVQAVEHGYYDEGRMMDFDDWTKRIGTSSENISHLTGLFRNASPALVNALKIEISGDKIGFALPRITLIAVKPRA